jgi:hypothetical protein
MKTQNYLRPTDLTSRNRVMAAAVICLLFVHLTAYGQVDWNQANSGGASSSGFWAGVSTIYSIIYGVFWVGAAICIGLGWFKFKSGDTAAALFSAGGGAGLGLTPLLIQWFRSLGAGGQLM